MIKSRIVITLAIFCSLGLLGLLFPSVGASLPAIETAFGISISKSGIISALVQLGYASFCFLGGILSDYIAKKSILIWGGVLYALGGLIMLVSPAWPLTLALFLLMGIGTGLIFISSNTLVIELYPEKRGTYLNIHHTFFAVGSLTAPLVVGALYGAGQPWSRIFVFLGVSALLISIVMALSDVSGLSTAGSNTRTVAQTTPAAAGRVDNRSKYLEVIREPSFLKLLFITLLAVGTQFGIIYMLVSFLVKTRSLPLRQAGMVLSAFFAFLMVGRLICSRLVTRYSAFHVIMGLLIMLSITLVGGWLTTGRVSLVLFALTGLACSGLMPTLLSLASRILAPQVMGAALGLLSMAGGLGGMLLSYLTSGTAEFIGLHYAFLVIVTASVIVTAYFFTTRKIFNLSS